MSPYDPQHHHRRSIRLKGYDYTHPGAYFITICTHGRRCLFGDVVDGKMRLNAAGHVAQQCWLDIPLHFPHVELDAFVIMPNHVHGILVIVDAGVDAGSNVGANAGSDVDGSDMVGANAGLDVDGSDMVGANAGLDVDGSDMVGTNAGLDVDGSDMVGTNAGSDVDGSDMVGTNAGSDVDGSDMVGAKNFSPLRYFSPLRSPSSSAPPSSSPLRSPSRTIGSVVRGFKIGVTKWFRQNTDVYDVWQRNYYEHIIRNEASLNRIREYIISNPLHWMLDRENPTTTAPLEERDYYRNIIEG